MWESEILILDDQVVLVECGPMRMFIDGSYQGERQPDICIRAGEAAIGFLEQIAKDRDSLKLPAKDLGSAPEGLLTKIMWSAAYVVDASDLTPMAAVAGTIADATADFLAESGLTRVIINNGGDLAVRLEEGEEIWVGIRPDVNKHRITHRLLINYKMGIGGICTSGLGGRSFTRGVASAVTILANRAAIADAAATAIANATYIQNSEVHREIADKIDPDTDLKGLEVTTYVGKLSDNQIELAIEQGITRSEELIQRGIIKGACVAVKSKMKATAKIALLLESLPQN